MRQTGKQDELLSRQQTLKPFAKTTEFMLANFIERVQQMGNDVELVAIPDVQDFSRAVQKLKSQYICRFHSKYKISGPVWRERYQSLLIEDERYLYACGQYIEDNPVKAGMVSVSRNWKYSSSAYYSSVVQR